MPSGVGIGAEKSEGLEDDVDAVGWVSPLMLANIPLLTLMLNLLDSNNPGS
jgi:hypothetical protein